ncbi:MAG: F0F1 ATP synthase subunit delta [Candidatus Moranbacteria bacterium]|nr:F0F1 ATP synthase subunit delta [Candidatus Moranbacteria bacterium]
MKISSTQYAKLIVALSKEGGEPARVVVSILAFVRKHRGIRKLSEIVRAAESLSDDEAGRVSLLAETATETDEEARKDIMSTAVRLFPGKEISLRYSVRKDLLGGVRLSSVDEVVDGTIRRRIRELRGSMTGF